MRTTLFIFLATLTVLLLIVIGTVAIVLNAIALVANFITAAVLLLFWRCGDCVVRWPTNRTVRARPSRVSHVRLASVHG